MTTPPARPHRTCGIQQENQMAEQNLEKRRAERVALIWGLIPVLVRVIWQLKVGAPQRIRGIWSLQLRRTIRYLDINKTSDLVC